MTLLDSDRHLYSVAVDGTLHPRTFRSKAFATVFERNHIASQSIGTDSNTQPMIFNRRFEIPSMAPKTCSSFSTFPATPAPCKLKKIWSLGGCTAQSELSSKHLPNVVQAVGESPVKKHRQVESLPPVCIRTAKTCCLKEMVGDSCYPQPVGKQKIESQIPLSISTVY